MNFILFALTDRNKKFKNNKEMVVIEHSSESMVFPKKVIRYVYSCLGSKYLNILKPRY